MNWEYLEAIDEGVSVAADALRDVAVGSRTIKFKNPTLQSAAEFISQLYADNERLDREVKDWKFRFAKVAGERDDLKNFKAIAEEAICDDELQTV